LSDDDLILYDYQAMDHAYEEMVQVSKQISDAATTLADDAHNVLQGMEGPVADGYNVRSSNLKSEADGLNDWMQKSVGALQEAFNRMNHADMKLGDGHW
jgi:uncharacterized protein YukE